MSRYRKIDPRMWGDEKFRSLSRPEPNAQSLWIYLLAGPHTGRLPGLFSIGRLALAEAIDWPLKAFDKAFAEVVSKGMVKADWKARVVFIPNALIYNPPNNPNVLKSWFDDWKQIPECKLTTTFYSELQGFMKGFGEGFNEAFENTWRKALLKPIGKQEPEPEQEPEPKQEQKKEDYTPTDQVIDYLNKKTNSSFKHSKASRENIHARLNGDGLTINDCKLLIDFKVTEWLDDLKTAGWLNPKTLFRPEKWEKNLNGARRWDAQGRPLLNSKGSRRNGQLINQRSLSEYVKEER